MGGRLPQPLFALSTGIVAHAFALKSSLAPEMWPLLFYPLGRRGYPACDLTAPELVHCVQTWIPHITRLWMHSVLTLCAARYFIFKTFNFAAHYSSSEKQPAIQDWHFKIDHGAGPLCQESSIRLSRARYCGWHLARPRSRPRPSFRRLRLSNNHVTRLHIHLGRIN